MDAMLIMQMVLFSIGGSLLYIIIGMIPGADETATIAPVTLTLILSGVDPRVILAYFVAVIVAMKMTDSITVSMAGIPSGVMSTPMIEEGKVMRDHARSDIGIRKGAAGSLIGVFVSLPLSLLVARLIAPLSGTISAYSGPILAAGAVFLALISTNKLISLLAILPFAFILQSIKLLHFEATAVPVSFFLAIAMGPIILNLFELAIPSKREATKAEGYSTTVLNAHADTSVQNPFSILTKEETKTSVLGSLLGTFTFFLSPVGMTVFLGDTITKREGMDHFDMASLKISVKSAITSTGYIAGILIPLIGLGLPLSPASLGPGNPLFNAPPAFTPEHNIHHILSGVELYLPIILGATVAIIVAYPLISKYAPAITSFVYRNLSQEALLGLFIGIVVMISYMDGGWSNIIAVISLALFSGFLNRWGFNLGIQFMSMYAAPFLVSTLLAL